jgi:hypothetical protein
VSNEIDEVVHLTELKDLQPKFDLDAYKKGLVIPLVAWLIVQILFLIFSYIDSEDVILAYGFGGYSIEIMLLFGAWASFNMIRSDGSFGDSIIGGFLIGLWASLIYLLFFGVINKPDGADIAENIMPVFWLNLLLHVTGALALAGLFTDTLFESGGPAKAPAKKKAAKKAKKATKAE